MMDDLTMDYLTEASINALRNPRHTVRRDAAIRLAQRRHPAALQALLDALYDNSNEVLLAVMDSLACYGDEAVPGLIMALQSIDSSVRFAAVGVLGEINSLEAESALIGCLQDDDPHVRTEAANALRRLNTPNARAALKN